MLLVRRNNYSNWLNDWFDNSFFDTEEVPQTRTTVPAINVGKRLTRIKRSALETMFLTRKESLAEREKPVPRRYSMEPEDCYTIGEESII